MLPEQSANDSRIHDIGYRRYDGARLGRGYALRSLYTHGLRASYGLGRSAKAKIFPWIIAGMVGAFAVVVGAIKAQTGQLLVSYQDMARSSFVLLLVFLAGVAPELVSRDLRNKTLPLYFSRPLHRGDYALARLGALVSAAFLLLAGQQMIVFAAAAFSSNGLTQVWHELRGLLGGLTIAGIYAVVFSCLALLIASLASRRAIAAGAIVAVFLVTAPIAGVLRAFGSPTTRELSWLVTPNGLVGGVRQWIFHAGLIEVGRFGPLYGGVALAFVVVAVTLLMLRYRRVSL
jgi:ABC-2 type transport system permease protein